MNAGTGTKQTRLRYSLDPKPTCQLHAMTCSCAPRPASRGGRAIAFIINLLTKLLSLPDPPSNLSGEE